MNLKRLCVFHSTSCDRGTSGCPSLASRAPLASRSASSAPNWGKTFTLVYERRAVLGYGTPPFFFGRYGILAGLLHWKQSQETRGSVWVLSLQNRTLVIKHDSPTTVFGPPLNGEMRRTKWYIVVERWPVSVGICDKDRITRDPNIRESSRKPKPYRITFTPRNDHVQALLEAEEVTWSHPDKIMNGTRGLYTLYVQTCLVSVSIAVVIVFPVIHKSR